MKREPKLTPSIEEATRNAARGLVILVLLLGFWADDSVMARAPLIKLYLEPFQTKMLQESMCRTVERMCRSFTLNRLIV